MCFSGEGQVYTVGKIGPHKTVSTKLSRIGHGQGAMVAAGNTVTRLLGEYTHIYHRQEILVICLYYYL